MFSHRSISLKSFKPLLPVVSVLLFQPLFAQTASTTPCPSTGTSTANAGQSIQNASDQIKSADSTRNTLQQQAKNINSGDQVSNAANMLNTLGGMHFGKKKNASAAAANPCPPANAAASGGAGSGGGITAGSGMIFSDARTGQAAASYKRGNAVWGFSNTVPVRSQPSQASPMSVSLVVPNPQATADASSKQINVEGYVIGYDAGGNAYVKESVPFPGTTYKVDNSGQVAEVSAAPAGLNYPSALTQPVQAPGATAAASQQATVMPVDGGKFLVTFTSPSDNKQMTMMMDPMNASSGGGQKIYKGGKYIVIVDANNNATVRELTQ